MTLSNEIQTFLVSQIEYYTKEAKSYKEMAREYNPDDNCWLYLLEFSSNIYKSKQCSKLTRYGRFY